MKIMLLLSLTFLFSYFGPVNAYFQNSKVSNYSGHQHSLETSTNNSITDLSKAPSAIFDGGLKYIPVDILDVNLKWNVDYDKGVVDAEAEIHFSTAESGRPIFILNPGAQATWQPSGQSVSLRKLSEALSGKKEISGNLLYIDEVVSAKTDHKLQLDYNFTLNHTDNMITLPLHYSRNKYAEMGIPSNLMFDRMKTDLKINVKSNDEFEVITNAHVTKHGKNSFSLDFPANFMAYLILSTYKKYDPHQNKKIKKEN